MRRQINLEHRSPSLHPMSGVLSVIRPHATAGGKLTGVAGDMVNARMAIAMRDNPTGALQLALMLAYRRRRS